MDMQQATPTLTVLTDAPAVQGPPQGQWTLADWERLPDDDNRYEIINGVLYRSKSPDVFHQWIGLNLYEHIGRPARLAGLAFPFLAPVGVIMIGTTPVQPDFVLVLTQHEAIIQPRGIYGVPDLIIEILSPGSKTYDEQVKRDAYAAAGVPEYGIVDPAARTFLYRRLEVLGQYGAPQTFTSADTLTFACLPTIPLQVGSLFAGAPKYTLPDEV